MPTFATVDDYIGSFSPDVGRTLEGVRAAIRAAIPGTDERISYGIPTYTHEDRYVVYFSGWKRHVSVYPIPHGDAELERDIAPYRSGKGTLRFALDRPMPLGLIQRVATRLFEQRLEREHDEG